MGELEDSVKRKVMGRLQGMKLGTDVDIPKLPLGLRSQTRIFLKDFLTSLSVSGSPQIPPPMLMDLKKEVEDMLTSVSDLTSLKNKLLGAVKELQKAQLPGGL